MGKRKGKGGNPQNQSNNRRQQPRILNSDDEASDDEEIPEDEAFNSDDERKYGVFFENRDDGEDSDNEGSSKEGSDEDDADGDEDASDDDDHADGDDDEQDDDGGQYMLDLLNGLDSNKNNAEEKKNQKPRSALIANNVPESEFSATIVPKAGLTLDLLMEGIQDTKGFGTIQKTMKSIAAGKPTAAPVANVVSERAKRKVHYQEQASEVSKWMDAIQENRKAETLDFRPKERLEITRDIMIEKFVPTTDFEKEIQRALEEAGQQDEEEILRAEEAALAAAHDDLGTNGLSLEEIKKRRGQLAKMRALMFYHEQKRHHINKIKSKKYRRIRKHQREKEKAAELEGQVEEDPDLARELAEKEEVERMKERMTLAHKNTSKWAKRVLKRGKNVDVDTRRALSAQLKRGDDLLKRMNATRRQDQEGSDDDDEENLVETARKVLADTEDNGSIDEELSKGNGLFNLAFMKKGIEKQRERAKQEARQLLLELEANEELDATDADEDKNDMNRDNNESKDKKDKNKVAVASKKEMKGVLQEGDMVASSLKFGHSTSVTVIDTVDVDALFSGQVPERKKGKQTTTSGNVSEHTANFSISTSATQYVKDDHLKKKSNSKKSTPQLNPLADKELDESNPWLLAPAKSGPAETNNTDSTKIPQRKSTKSEKRGYVDVDLAIDMLESTPRGAVSKKDEVTTSDDRPSEKKITTLTQEELVRRAFASISEQEAEEEFAREKAKVEEQEDPTRKVKKQKDMDSASGWGSWTGSGAPPPRKSRTNLPAHLQPPAKQPLPKRKREDSKRPNVILSQKRAKKLADKFMIQQIPYPYTSREEYERAMAGGIGREWNVSSSFKDMTRPEIITRPGKIIQPLSKRAKQARAPAKF